MRFEGTLVRWDDVRGIGYLASSQGGEPLFVHISALPVAGGRPRQGDRFSFEVEPNPRGGKQAVRGLRIGPVRHPALQPVDPERSTLGASSAQRAGLSYDAATRRASDGRERTGGHDRRQARPPLPRAANRPQGQRRRSGFVHRVVRLALGLTASGIVAVVGLQAWRARHADPFDSLPPTSAGVATHAVDFSAPQVTYRCDGRQHCSQMRSCNEARYFLAHCPGVVMDGDHDGIPCEENLCGH